MVLRLKAWESRSSPGLPNPGHALLGVPRDKITDNASRACRRRLIEEPPQIFRPASRARAPAMAALGAGWSSPVARQAHNLKVAGSNPAPATTLKVASDSTLTYLLVRQVRAAKSLLILISIPGSALNRCRRWRAISSGIPRILLMACCRSLTSGVLKTLCIVDIRF